MQNNTAHVGVIVSEATPPPPPEADHFTKPHVACTPPPPEHLDPPTKPHPPTYTNPPSEPRATPPPLRNVRNPPPPLPKCTKPEEWQVGTGSTSRIGRVISMGFLIRKYIREPYLGTPSQSGCTFRNPAQEPQPDRQHVPEDSSRWSY